MEQKFTLDEAFDIFYQNVLQEQVKEDLTNISEELESDCFYESYEILTELMGGGSNTTDKKEQNENGDTKPDQKENKPEKKDNNYESVFKTAMDTYEKMFSRATDLARKTAANITPYSKQSPMVFYKPDASQVQITPISKMKFPDNIIFFVTQLLTWIKNNIINIIDRLSNVIRSMLGLKISEKKFTPDQLRLTMNKVEKIEGKYLINTDRAYTRLGDARVDNINNINGFEPDKVKYGSAMKPVMALSIDPRDIKLIDESVILPEDTNILTEDNDYDRYDHDEKHMTKVISIDTTHDLMALQQSLEHFFDLFDNAFGSNDENLFSIDDLKIMLELFKSTLDELNHPSYGGTSLEIQGELYKGGAISATKLKDNLLRTRINTDNLKEAYTMTNKQINAIAQIIGNKNLIGLSSMGVQYAILSASTYGVMADLLEMIDKRLKDAGKMEKDLQSMKTSYEKLVSELDGKRMALKSVGGFTWTTVMQRSIEDLYNGARYMTQTVQLRLNTIALYISELNDTKAILKNLNAINEMNGFKKSGNKGVLDRIKEIFDRRKED